MVEPLVVSPSGVDAIALGDNAAFEHNGVLVQHDGIGAGEVGRTLAFVRDPRFVGTGFFAGEAPDGLTTVYGDPISADVFVYWRDPDDLIAQEVLVGATKSAPDGTWLITGLNYNLRYVVRARASGRDDVTVVGVQPSRADVITYEGEFTNTEDFDGVAGEILITSGLPPFTATVIQPLPSGLFPVVSGRNLIIEGTTNADEVASFDVKVTSSNGAEKIIPLQIVFGFKAPQNFASKVIIDDDVFSVALTWKVASSTQQVKVYRSETPFDMDDLPVPLAVLTGSATTYTDDDVVEDEAFYYMVSAEREGYVRYSVVVREFIRPGSRYWRIKVTRESQPYYYGGSYLRYCQLSELQFNGVQATGGMPLASSSTEGEAGFGIAKAFDGDKSGNSQWGSVNPSSALGEWLGYAFAAPQAVNSVSITSRNHNPIGMYWTPQGFDVESSIDGIEWLHEWSVPGPIVWGQAQTKTFERP